MKAKFVLALLLLKVMFVASGCNVKSDLGGVQEDELLEYSLLRLGDQIPNGASVEALSESGYSAAIITPDERILFWDLVQDEKVELSSPELFDTFYVSGFSGDERMVVTFDFAQPYLVNKKDEWTKLPIPDNSKFEELYATCAAGNYVVGLARKMDEPTDIVIIWDISSLQFSYLLEGENRPKFDPEIKAINENGIAVGNLGRNAGFFKNGEQTAMPNKRFAGANRAYAISNSKEKIVVAGTQGTDPSIGFLWSQEHGFTFLDDPRPDYGSIVHDFGGKDDQYVLGGIYRKPNSRREQVVLWDRSAVDEALIVDEMVTDLKEGEQFVRSLKMSIDGKILVQGNFDGQDIVGRILVRTRD